MGVERGRKRGDGTAENENRPDENKSGNAGNAPLRNRDIQAFRTVANHRYRWKTIRAFVAPRHSPSSLSLGSPNTKLRGLNSVRSYKIHLLFKASIVYECRVESCHSVLPHGSAPFK